MEDVKLTTLFHLKPKFRMNGAIPLLPHMPAGVDRDSYSLFLLSLTIIRSLFAFRRERERGTFWRRFQEASP